MTIEENLSLAVKRGQRQGLRLGLDKNRQAEFIVSPYWNWAGETPSCPVKLLSGDQTKSPLMATMNPNSSFWTNIRLPWTRDSPTDYGYYRPDR